MIIVRMSTERNKKRSPPRRAWHRRCLLLVTAAAIGAAGFGVECWHIAFKDEGFSLGFPFKIFDSIDDDYLQIRSNISCHQWRVGWVVKNDDSGLIWEWGHIYYLRFRALLFILPSLSMTSASRAHFRSASQS